MKNLAYNKMNLVYFSIYCNKFDIDDGVTNTFKISAGSLY